MKKLMKHSRISNSLDKVQKELKVPDKKLLSKVLRLNKDFDGEIESERVVAEEEAHYILIRGRQDINKIRSESRKSRNSGNDSIDSKEVLLVESDDEDIVDTLKRKLKNEKKDGLFKKEKLDVKYDSRPIIDEIACKNFMETHSADGNTKPSTEDTTETESQNGEISSRNETAVMDHDNGVIHHSDVESPKNPTNTAENVVKSQNGERKDKNESPGDEKERREGYVHGGGFIQTSELNNDDLNCVNDISMNDDQSDSECSSYVDDIKVKNDASTSEKILEDHSEQSEQITGGGGFIRDEKKGMITV